MSVISEQRCVIDKQNHEGTNLKILFYDTTTILTESLNHFIVGHPGREFSAFRDENRPEERIRMLQISSIKGDASVIVEQCLEDLTQAFEVIEMDFEKALIDYEQNNNNNNNKMDTSNGITAR